MRQHHVPIRVTLCAALLAIATTTGAQADGTSSASKPRTVRTTRVVASKRSRGPKSASEARLGLFTARELALLEPFITQGPVALIEFKGEAELPAIIFGAQIHAPAREVVQVLTDPAAFPNFMPALDKVKVLSRSSQRINYAWHWQTALFAMDGQSKMTILPPPKDQPNRGHRIAIDNLEGDLGTGRMMWRVTPVDARTSLVVFSSRMDLRKANWVTRQLNSGKRSINRTINIALSWGMLRGIQRASEAKAGNTRLGAKRKALSAPPVNTRELAALLNRGDLVLIDMRGETLQQVATVGRMFRPYKTMHKVMQDPTLFGPALVPGAFVDILDKKGNHIDFRWGIDLPLIGTGGEMRFENRGSLFTVEATKEALKGGQWHFVPVNLPWTEGAVITYGNFDPATASWLVKAFISSNSDLSHGIVIGSQVMVTRAIRSRTRKAR